MFSLRNSEFFHLTGLRREVSEQDSTQLDYVMPMVQNGLNKTTKALSECISVKDVVSSWYDFLIVLVYGKWVVISGKKQPFAAFRNRPIFVGLILPGVRYVFRGQNLLTF